ncbi:MAG: asparagine N-glycosylation enzyme membrane subunit Stt3 [Candidatus Paceibacteria bacterium]|jgi:asparagine N-glycosylation enzyme membrane subunit Stt3
MNSRWALGLTLLLVLACSAIPRWSLHDRTPSAQGSWTVSDPDSLYHARRVERALLEGALPASTDDFLNHPEGAIIPWPPYYDALVATLLSPFHGRGDALDRTRLERNVAWLPFVFGLLTSLTAFFAARQLAGLWAGLGAGGLHALALGSVVYSRVGNGDHHAFLSLLAGLLFWGCSWMLQRDRLESRQLTLGAGILLGAMTGFGIGSWVAFLVLAVLVDLVFAVLLVLQTQRPRAGLAAFGLAFHLAALFTLLPAVLASPWKEEFPWMVVNLSWFHLTYLGLGALVFLPLMALRTHSRVHRFYPWIVAGALALFLLATSFLEHGPIAGLREGFAWVSRQNSFMSGIEESRPLFGEGAIPGGVLTYIGAFGYLLPFAWLAALGALWKEHRFELLPWVVVLPPLALQAAGQVRFADVMILPGAVLVAWLVTCLFRKRQWNIPTVLLAPLVLLLVGVSQASTCMRLMDAYGNAQSDSRRKQASRELCDWLSNQGTNQENDAVLANWKWGHEIEWAARRPSVATNFGSYVGEVGFLSPARFFLSADAGEAEAVLEERGASIVMLSVDLSDGLPGWIQAGPSEWDGKFYRLDAQGLGQLLAPWFESIGGQLLNGGFARPQRGAERRNSIDFLRLLHVSPTTLRKSPISNWKGPSPYGWIWERVPGAQVVLKGRTGDLASVQIEVEYTAGPRRQAQTVRFLNQVVLDGEGRASLRVPYNTTSNGDGKVLRAEWRVGVSSGPLVIEEREVQGGLEVPINP